MATQQILFAETIAGMKKAFKRKSYESDSDSDIESYTNRGHKLKKRARFAHKGQLVPAVGPGAYRETVDFAGVQRSIIHRNPPLLDDEGYEVDSDDDTSRIEYALASAAELNPYANVRLEHILAPLTASTDLPSHPVLSKPFTSNTLTNLVSQSCRLMRKENQSLWQVRHLWTTLCGDGSWIPCESMIGPNDVELFTEDHVARHLLDLSKTRDAEVGSPAMLNGETRKKNNEGKGNTPSVPNSSDEHEGASGDADVPMADVDVSNKSDEGGKPDTLNETSGTGVKDKPEAQKGKKKGSSQTPGVESIANADGPRIQGGEGKQAHTKRNNAKSEASQRQTELASQKETCSELENQNSDVVAMIGSLVPSFIHPMFLPPAGAQVDRDLGLPENEAEDIRRLLALYVQKQEEVCRGAKRLHAGLLRAEHLRKDVLHWAKAEAHCGPNRDMSDGEDWYDKEEWGLVDDLKKGQDEEEEDTVTAGKKTRARR